MARYNGAPGGGQTCEVARTNGRRQTDCLRLESSDALAEAIAFLPAQPECAAEMGCCSTGRKRVSDGVDAYETLYQKLLKEIPDGDS